MGIRFNPFTGNLDYVGSASSVATEAPKLVVQFNCDAGVSVGDLLYVSGDNEVTSINDNSLISIPNGIFGVAYTKPSSILVNVMFSGVKDGYSGFTTGQSVYVGTDGAPTNAVPATGMVQQIGFAVSSTEFFVQLMQPLARG